MKSKKLVLFFYILFSSKMILAQEENNHSIRFHPLFNNSLLSLENTYYTLVSGDSIQFESLKFYISGIELLNDDKLIWKEENSFHLIDVANEKTMQVFLKSPSNIFFNKIKFNLGIDSITNVSGAMGGDLDPTKGMYWTWQNGYINFKLEGRSNLCKTRKNEFQFHLGGYQYPFGTIQNISLMTVSNKQQDIFINLEKLINEIDLTKENQIMSPRKETVELSKKASKIFSIQQK